MLLVLKDDSVTPICLPQLPGMQAINLPTFCMSSTHSQNSVPFHSLVCRCFGSTASETNL